MCNGVTVLLLIVHLCQPVTASLLLQEMDVLNPNSPVYDEELVARIRGLQRQHGPLCQRPFLLSGLSKQQHAWYLDHFGENLSPLAPPPPLPPAHPLFHLGP